MATPSPPSPTVAFLLLLTTLSAFPTSVRPSPPGLTLTVVNNCRFPIWPAIQPNAGHPVLERGGFRLANLSHRSFPAPSAHWSGRIWARTACSHAAGGRFSCATGDCGGRLECNGLGGAAPATLAQFSLHHGHADFSSYGVSLVDGFNLPMTVTPHEGKGVCPVVGCRKDLLATCPQALQVRGPPHGGVVGCKSGCAALGTDQLCCRNHYNSPQTCKPSSYSDYFKQACPATFTYAHDSPSLMHECSSPRELKVIFCH
ncbi:osmotin-like protein [Andrographis paniculata]|uniref:osmotin-like protein n=1 Tax=Andrographis paniculata TaxID=175694 RepID=UPI0021E6E21F|nr:osmotin-like protein [Andrographis paniculata]